MSVNSLQNGRKSRSRFHTLYKAIRLGPARGQFEQLENRILLSSVAPLVVTTQPPANVAAGQSFGVTITAENGDGSVNTPFNGPITLSDQYGQRIYGTTTVQARSGVATFSGLSEHTAVNGDEIEANASGLPTAYSNSFNITAASATHLVAPAPGGVLVNGAFSLTVVAEDQYSNIDPTFQGSITLSLAASPAGGTLGGTLIATAVSGQASFTNLTINKFGSGYALKATATGLPAVTTPAFAANDQLVVTTQPPGNVTAGSAFNVVVTAEDGLGKADPSFHGTVNIANVPGSTLAGPLSASATNGVATFAGLAEDQATTYPYLVVSSLGLASADTNPINVSAAAATHLVASAPSATLVNGAFTIAVSAQDPFGNTDPTFTGNVTLALATNPTSATLSGTLTVRAAGGVAAFTGLTINKLGSGYSLKATTSTLRSATTALFNMTDQLVVTTQPPSSITAGGTFGLVVSAEDGDGNLDTSFNTNVSVADNYGYQVYGSTTVAASNGVATFSGLAEHIAINGDELQASSSGLPTALSSTFNIIGAAATHLSVSAPANVVAIGAFSLAVDAEDQFGNVDPTFTGSVTLALATNPGGATLGGALTVQAVKGIATFTGLSINMLAEGYTFLATTPGLSSGATLPFNVTDQLVVTTQPPSSLPVGTPFDLVVQVENGDGAVDTSFQSNVTVRDYYGHHVYGATTVQAVNGVASFSGLSEHAAVVGDVLEVTSAGLPAGYSSSFNDVQLAATQLQVSAPSAAVVNGAFTVTVHATDPYGNVDPNFNGTVTLALPTNPGSAALGGVLTAPAFNGVATFSGITINSPASGYVLQASTSSLGAFTTSPFNATYQLVVTTQPPTNFSVDTPFGLAVAVEDGDGVVQTSFNSNITLSDVDANKLYGTLTVQAANGVAVFSNLAEAAAINGDELQSAGTGLPTTVTGQFTVAPITATQLSAAAPSGVQNNGAFTLTVQAVDSSGVVDSTFDGNVTLSLSGDTNGATLGGTLTVQAFDGVATFTGLTLNKLGNGYTLSAAAIGLSSAVTPAFSVSDALSVTTQPPTTVETAAPFGLVVAAKDALGNIDTSFNGAVTIAAQSGLSGTLSVNAVNGIATFAELSIGTPGTGYTLQISSSGLSSTAAAAIKVTDVLVVTTQPPTAIAAAAPFGLAVAAENALGVIDSSFTGTITLADADGNSLSGKLSAVAVNGMASFAGLSEANVLGNDSLTAASSGLATVHSTAFSVVPPTHTIPPVAVLFAVAPAGGVAGSDINPAIVVNVVDTNNDVVATDHSQVTLTLHSGPAGADIGETFTAAALNGVATFNNVVLDVAGGNYTFTASDPSLASAIGGAFAITPAAADKLVFVQQPTAVVAGAAITPAITLDVEDQFNNLVTSNTSTVTLAVNTPAGAILSGTDSVQVSGGVATFNNVILDTTGNYTLSATDGSLPALTSTSFAVTPGAASKLIFTQQPVNTSVSGAISPAITVTVEDQFDNVVSTDGSKVTLTAAKIPAGAMLGGTLSIHAVNGVATFSGITPSKAGAYALTATDGSLADATSDGFSAGQLAITQQPTNLSAGATIPLAVTVEKPSGKVIGADDSQMTVSIQKGPAGAPLGGTAIVTAVKGVATFSNLSLTKAGAYTLTITDGGSTVKTVKFTVSAAAATQLSFAPLPASVTAGQAISPAITVTVEDAFGNPITGTKLKLAVAGGPTGAALGGTLKATIQNGVAAFNNISLTQSGSYTFRATHGSLTATSGSFTVTPAAASKLAFIQQPTAAAAGAAIAPAMTVDVEDTFGNIVTTDDSNVTLVIKPNSGPTGAILSGTLTVAAQNGVATFSDVLLSEAGTYKLRAGDGQLGKAKSAAFNILAA